MKPERLADVICSRLFNLRSKESLGGNYYPIISAHEQPMVLEAVHEAIKSVTIDGIAELEAKVFVYEEIIKKSNFGPMFAFNELLKGDQDENQ